MKERICYIVAGVALTLVVISITGLCGSVQNGGSFLSVALEIGGVLLGNLILKVVGMYEW